MLHIDNARKEKMRHEMVDRHIAARGVGDSYVLEAMRTVPRDEFMPDDVGEYAYEDAPAPIGYGQTISQPFIVALMAELAELHPTDKVLEIGTGSGYGAAILGQIAKDVYSVERHKPLAERAANILRHLDYNNIQVMHTDGTEGLPQEAPFDAIVVTAGAPEVPEELKQQLKIGGRLVIPVGEGERRQNLLQIRRMDVDEYDTNDYGAVAFVPLVGKHGWEEKVGVNEQLPAKAMAFLRSEQDDEHLISLLEQDAEPLPEPESPHFGQFFDRLGDAKIVLLGESTHGTAEFYRARAAITQRLIRNHGFTILALEADWPDAAMLNAHIYDRPTIPMDQPAFSRFPEWMWRNREFAQLVDWMKKHNSGLEEGAEKAGIYGLDVYSLKSSAHAVINLLEEKDPEMAEIARTRYGCFSSWLDDPINYGRAAVTEQFAGCEQEAVTMLMDLMEEQVIDKGGNFTPDEFLDLSRNAEVVANAEKYYRMMFLGTASTWNLRDKHMFNTLQAALHARGPDAKAIVWAHNSHIGDARATEMGMVREELNLGQLCRENYGDEARLVGFGTGSGEVAAASYWGGPMEIKLLRSPLKSSYENLWSRSRLDNALLDIREGINEELAEGLETQRLQRMIGVVYRPETERMSHYFSANPVKQFDHYVWFRETTAVGYMPQEEMAREEGGEAETFPFGL